MPDPVTGIIGGASVIGGVSQSKSAKKATRAQQQDADASIAEQRRQFDALQGLLRPYVDAGAPALRGLMDLAGLSPTTTNWTAYANSNPALLEAFRARNAGVQGGPAPVGGAGNPYGIGDTPGYNPNRAFVGSDLFLNPNDFLGNRGKEGFFNPGGRSDIAAFGGQGGQPQTLEQFAEQYYRQNGGDISQFQNNPQAQAIAQLEGQPQFQALLRQGEDAILQNASATGGLRGGNTQSALSRFRPQLLNQFIEQQYARLAGITSLGQSSAAGVGNAGIQTGQNIGNTLIGRGEATAAGAGAQGKIFSNLIGNLGGAFAAGIGGNSNMKRFN
jgi:hypothetical protein